MILTSTHQNHLKIGYGPLLKPHREMSYFQVCSGPARQPDSFKIECLRAARLIAESAQMQNKKIVIALSGGLDSEVVARAFLEASIPFEATTLRYLPDLNEHDNHYAFHFCKMNNIKLNIIDIDVMAHYQTEQHKHSYEKYCCNSPMFSVHLDLCRRFENDFLILGGIVPILHVPHDIHNHSKQLSLFNIIEKTFSQFSLAEFPVENTFCFDHYFNLHKTSGVSHFFLYTPELVLSSLAAGNVLKQIDDINTFSYQYPASQYENIPFYHSQKITNILKYNFFRQEGFTVLPRERKLTGFEKIHQSFGPQEGAQPSYQNELKGLIRFNELYRKPMEAQLPKQQLGVFNIDSENKIWLKNHALINWSSTELKN